MSEAVPPDILVGIDTHKHVHAAVAITALGARLGELSFPVGPKGYRQLAAWAGSLGKVRAFGIEGTGSYGAGVSRFLRGEGHSVVEVSPPDRRSRHRHGKTDPLDAESAARAVLAGQANAVPKSGASRVEMIRHLKVARDGAVKARSQAMLTLQAVIVGAPEALRERLEAVTGKMALIRHLAALRPGPLTSTTASAKASLRALARRWLDLALSGWWSLAGTMWLGQADGMTPASATYPGHRFPAEVISHAVWLYHVFSLSLRDVELILAERGVVVSHESIRQWGLRFGADFARKLRRRRPRPGDTWHLDEVFLRINGKLHYLWRAVDQHGVVLDILVQDRRNANAAKRFFKRLLAGLKYKPKRIVTDGLRSYGVAKREVLPEVRHRTSRYLNNRAENSHRPTRRRERQMQRFKSPEQAQRFLSSHGMIYGHFRPRRHLMTAARYRRARAEAFRVWRRETCVQVAA